MSSPNPQTLSPSSLPTVSPSTMSHTHSTSTSGMIWAELASLTLQAFTPDLINRLQSFIANTPSFDTATHIPLLATLVIRHITLALRESASPKTRSFRDVAYHAVMSNKIITKRERSVVRAVSVGKLHQKDEPVLQDVDGVREGGNEKAEMFPRAGRKDCIQSVSTQRLLIANQAPLEISLLEEPRKDDAPKKESQPNNARKRERKRGSIRYVPPRSNENRESKYRQSIHRSRPTVCEDTSAPNDVDVVDKRNSVRRDDTLKEPRVRRERPSRLVQLRRQRLERRKGTVT